MFKAIQQLFQHSPSRIVGISFAILSIMFGSWITRIPEVKDKLLLSESDLGLALLGISIGGLLIMPFTPVFMKRFGSSKMLIWTSILICFSPLPLILAPNFWTLVAAAILFGASTGTMDVVINTLAAAVEKRDGVVIMSSCHGMFSLGGTIGAVLGSFLAGMSISGFIHLSAVGLLMLLLTLSLISGASKLPEADAEEEGFAVPTRPILGLAIIGFCIMLGEGAVADWSAVYLQDELQSNPFLVGMGFAGFTLTMTIGRFYGDIITPKIGAARIVRYGSLIGAIGMAIAIFAPNALLAILGFALVGIGFAGIVPILFRAAANVEGVPSGIGVASVTTTGILGFLLGPPLIGFISEASSLKIGLGLVVLLSLIAFLAAQKVRV